MAVVINTENLSSYSNLINDKLFSDYDSLSQSILDLKNTLSDIGNHWQGSDFDAFNLKMEDFVSELNKVCDFISELQTNLDDYIKDVDNLDDKYGSIGFGQM